MNVRDRSSILSLLDRTGILRCSCERSESANGSGELHGCCVVVMWCFVFLASVDTEPTSETVCIIGLMSVVESDKESVSEVSGGKMEVKLVKLDVEYGKGYRTFFLPWKRDALEKLSTKTHMFAVEHCHSGVIVACGKHASFQQLPKPGRRCTV